MTTRKRNEFLDAGLSDDDFGQDYDSEAAEEAKGISRKAPKRRKLQPSSDDDDDDDDNEEADEGVSEAEDVDGIISEADPKGPPSPPSAAHPPVKKLQPLTPAQLAASQRAARKTGVLYLSRIPPFMRPSTVKHLLSPYGSISRLFLTPEPPSSHSKRISSGGNKKRSFIDGWVEFTSKKDAKICAETINGQIVGGKKGGWYHDDIWNVKYLRGFKWGDLMAQVREEERSREERLRVEVQRVGRERREFLGNLERAKVEETRRRKREGRKKVLGDDGVVDEKVGEGEKGRAGFERRFRQIEVRMKTEKGRGREEQPEEVKRVLSKIF